MGIDDVFDASTTSGRVTSPSVRKMRASPRAARSPPRSPGRRRPAHARSVAPWTRQQRVRVVRRRACRVPRPCRTERSTRGPARDQLRLPSTNVTSAPAARRTSTMPEPIRPQPTTPTCRTSSAFIAPSVASWGKPTIPGHPARRANRPTTRGVWIAKEEVRTSMLAHAGGAPETLSVVLLFAGIWVGWAGWSRIKGRGFPRMPRGGAYALMGGAALLALSAAVVPPMIWGPNLKVKPRRHRSPRYAPRPPPRSTSSIPRRARPSPATRSTS